MTTIRWKTRVVVVLLLGMSVTLLGTFALFRSVRPRESDITSRQHWKRNGNTRVASFHKPTEPVRRTARRAQIHTLAPVDQRHDVAARTLKPRNEVRLHGEKASEQSEIHKMINHALKLNIEEKVLNLDKFPKGLEDDGIILAVQVHSRTDYFKYFISSLRSVRNIERALVIISHDFYSKEMEQLVASIDFCRVGFNHLAMAYFVELNWGKGRSNILMNRKRNFKRKELWLVGI